MKSKSIVIAVAGGSGSGKTYLSDTLSQCLINVLLLSMDDYYRDRSALSIEEREKIDYDSPAAIDFALLTEHIKELKKGRAVKKPIYDFMNHVRKADVVVLPKEIIIIEGLFILNVQETLGSIDLKIFVDTPESIRYQRRLSRDIKERGRTELSVRKQYGQYVKPAYDKYVEPSKINADHIVSGEMDAARICAEIIPWIKGIEQSQ